MTPPARLRRRAVALEPPDRRQEIAIGILGVDAGLDRPAVELHVALLDGKSLAGRDADHLLDQIDAGDELGHRVLDLQPRIHFQEIEALSCAGDELDGAGAIVAHGFCQRDRLLAHRRAGGGVEERARRLLHDLLVAPLDRAFALAEIDDIAVLVAEHLDFDMARIGDEFLDEHPIVAERRSGLRAGAGEALRHLAGALRRCACPCRRRPRTP